MSGAHSGEVRVPSPAMAPGALEFLIPGDLRAATGGYVYDRRLIQGLRELGWQVRVHRLDESFPHPSSAALAQARAVLQGLAEAALVLIDGLALGAMPELVVRQATRLTLLALVHSPLACEIGLAPKVARELERSERRALQAVRHVIVTGRATEQRLRTYGVAAECITLIEPGTDRAPLAHRRYDGQIELLCVATLNPGKGHEQLIEALAPLTHLPWRLTCVGSLTRSPATVERLRSQIDRCGLSERVRLVGEVSSDELVHYFLAADLFVLATHFESYGMAAAEALAYGLPLISTRTGAIPDLVGEQAGWLVPPGDAGELRAALAASLADPARLAQFARAAAQRRERLPRWPSACQRVAELCSHYAGAVAASNAPRGSTPRPARTPPQSTR